MNNCSMVGRLTRDPELRYLPNGKPVCKFSLAVDDPFRKDEAGKTQADFFNVSVFGAQAESCSKYLQKGQKAGVEGSVHIRKYQGKDGKEGVSVEFSANRVHFYEKSSRQQDGHQSSGQPAPVAHRDTFKPEPPPQRPVQPGAEEEDLPF